MKHKDPVTGDELTSGERISWVIQGVIRNWYFLILFSTITIIVWSINNPTGLLWWNLAASYLAIIIESIVGISMFSQCKRDAVVLREVRTISQHVEKILDHIQETVDIEQKEIEEIEEMLERDEE